MKKIISIIISIVMIANCMIFVASATNITETTVFSEDGAYAYALEVAGKHIGISGDATDMSASYSISNGYKIVGSADQTCRAFFAFMDNDCIGQLNVAFLDGRYFATYYSADLPLITDMYENDSPFTLYRANDRVYLIDNEKSYVFNGADDNAPFFSNVLEKTPITMGAITVTVSENNYARAILSKYLDAPKVANEQDYFDRWLCWAACVASMVMYKTTYRNLTARGVWDELVSNLGLEPDQAYHVASQYTRKSFKMYDLSTSKVDSGMSFNTVKSHINNNEPLIISIFGDDIFGERQGHNVIICGYNQTGEGYWYQFMDPNEKGYIYFCFDDPNRLNLEYSSSYGVAFTEWNETIW